MPEQVFLNSLPEDRSHVEMIKKRLEAAAIAYYAAPERLTPALQQEMVEKIKEIAAAHGCMLCVLSQKAVSDSLYMSNIQLMCEAARSRRVLVKYPVEALAGDQGIRLFDSQAYLVKRSGHEDADISAIIQRIHQIIHPDRRNVWQMLTAIISRKALVRTFILVAVLGVIASLVFNYVKGKPSTPSRSVPTPVMIFTPFSDQSQDAGLVVDARYVPAYTPAGDPARDAPFHFTPATVLEQQDFTDPAFENSLDGRKWNLYHFMLGDIASMAVTQTHGVLQMAVAPVGNQPVSLALESKYLFNPEQVTYLGYRFRLDDYRGKVMENTSFVGYFAYADLNFDGISQRLMDEAQTDLGSRWHALEMVSQKDRHRINVYLDGKLIKTLMLDDTQLTRWEHCNFYLDAANTTDWARIQIEAIVFGADQALPEALQPEDARYRFTPDTIDIYQDFETQAIPPDLVNDPRLTHTNGVLSFRIPAGKDEQGFQLELPGKPIDVDNYYATRFRFTSPDEDAWNEWAGYHFGLKNNDLQSGFDLTIGSARRELNFEGHYGINGVVNAFAYNQNAGPGFWHALEMVIEPPASGVQPYTVYYWVDGYLLGKGDLDNAAPFLDENAPLFVILNINGGSYRQNVFSGEIDDLIVGTLSGDKIQE